MIKPKIALDWDDVTAPFNSIAVQMANEKYSYLPGYPFTLEDVISWGSYRKDAEVISEFYTDPELYRRQTSQISEEVKKNIRKLMEYADVYFMTAPYIPFMGMRAQQIKETFPELPDNRIILGAAKHLVHFDIILDDNICNVLESPAEFAVLMRKPWNSSMTGLLSVNNLDEFVSLVEHLLQIKKPEQDLESARVIALVGPSGSGKNDIAKGLSSLTKLYAHPISYSTKRDGAHAWMSEEEFKKQNFFEHTMYAGNHYGTRKEDISAVLDSGRHAVIPLDMCGAIAMKRVFPTTIIYIRRGKVSLISDIVSSSLTAEEKTLRILSLEAERKNSAICDFIVDGTDVAKAVKQIVELTGGIRL